MFLNFYLKSTAISWVIYLTYMFSFARNIEKEGYKSVEIKRSFLEKVGNHISTILLCSVPILNILLSIIFIWYDDKIYNDTVEKLLKEGSIYMPINEMNEIDDEFIPKEETKISNEIIEKEISKKYEEMTLEEKIAFLNSEKEKLIMQSMAISQPIEDNLVYPEQDYQGPTLKRTLNSKQK